MRIVRALFFTLFALSHSAFAETTMSDYKLLETNFLTTSEFQLIHKHQQVPNDVREWFWAIVRSRKIVNYGEAFNRTDIVDGNYPMAQHQYTLVSDRVSASLIKQGGFAPVQWLLLVNRASPHIACTYHVKWELEFRESLQYIIRNKEEVKDTHFQSFPICRPIKK